MCSSDLDQRRLLLDQCDAIANVWLEMLSPSDPSWSALSRSAHTSGLYRLVVLPSQANVLSFDVTPDPASDAEIVSCVHSCFSGFRNLCEDLVSVEVLQPQPFEIKSLQLALEPEADPDVVLASLLYQLGLILNPEPKRQSLQQWSISQPVREAPFEGPLPRQGFVADEQLGDRPCQLETEQLRQLLCAVDGVIELERMSFCCGATSADLSVSLSIDIPRGHYLHIQLHLDDPLTTILLLKNNGQVAYNPVRLKRLLANLWRQHHQTFATGTEAETLYGLPAATGGDLTSYTSLVGQFPSAYQLQGSEADAAVSFEAIAKRRQLKAYLMIFDQFMADALAQLAFLPQLFSLQTGLGHTWQAYSLKRVSGCDPSLLTENYEDALEKLRSRFD